MAGLLTLTQWLGSPTDINVETVTPNEQTTVTYNFKADDGSALDVSGWEFTCNQQTIVVDQLTFNRNSGEPNFSSSAVIGTFPASDITANAVITTDAVNGNVTLTKLADIYTGPIIPDARTNVPMTILTFTWVTDTTPPDIRTNKWALVQSWEPGVTAGDPTTSITPLYTAL